MYVSPETLRFMLELGLPGDKLVELFQRLEEDAAMGAVVVDGPSADLQALERRRAKDRERKRNVRGNSAEMSADKSADDPLPPSSSPEPPTPPTHTRKENTTRAKTRRVPADWQPSAKTLAVAEVEGFAAGELERVMAKMRDHEFRDAHSDWDAVCRNWLRSPFNRPTKTTHGPPNNPKLAARQANLERSFAGSESAAERWRRERFGT